jgi:hypothetical protein
MMQHHSNYNIMIQLQYSSYHGSIVTITTTSYNISVGSREGHDWLDQRRQGEIRVGRVAKASIRLRRQVKDFIWAGSAWCIPDRVEEDVWGCGAQLDLPTMRWGRVV